MCGIVGAASTRNIVPILIDGIRRLEYRGYDSSGLAVINGRRRAAARAAGERCAGRRSRGAGRREGAHGPHRHLAHALGHARRATQDNAHPHMSHGEIAVVHNGIIENFETLRERLQGRGYVFSTQTDTEVIAHLVHSHWHAAGGGDLLRAVRAAVAEFDGAYAIAVISTHEPGASSARGPGARWSSASATDDHFLASDAAALLSVTRRVVYLDEGDFADVRRESFAIYDARGEQVERASSPWKRRATGRARPVPPLHAEGDLRAAARGRRHARGVAAIDAKLFGAHAGETWQVDSVLVLACGTSHYSALVAKQWIEWLAGIPCQVEIASEYRYRDSVPIRTRSSSSSPSPARPPTPSPR